MSDELVERLSRSLAQGLSRRTVAGLAGLGVVAALPILPGADAKKTKKKRKGDKNKGPNDRIPPLCQGNCTGKVCGSDGCGKPCGVCDPGEICTSGACVEATSYESVRIWTPFPRYPTPFLFDLTLRGDTVAVTDTLGNQVQTSTTTGIQHAKWAVQWDEPGDFTPNRVALDSQGNVHVVDFLGFNVQVFSATGQFVTRWDAEAPDPDDLVAPFAIAIDAADTVYVLCNGRELQTFTTTGSPRGTIQLDAVVNGAAFALRDDGGIVLLSSESNTVSRYSASGTHIKTWGGPGSAEGEFNTPLGIAVDRQGAVYVADSGNDRIQKFSGSGDFLTAFGGRGSDAGQLINPIGIAVDASGLVYVAELANTRVQVFAPVASRENSRSAPPPPPSARHSHRRRRRD